MLVSTKAIVFSALKYGEADLIVKCFTQKSGLKAYLLRGILKSKKGKIKKSLFQPLTQLEIVANHKEKGQLEYMREARVYNPYQSMHTHVGKAAVAMFLAEILKNTIQEEEANGGMYLFLENSFYWFDSTEKWADFHLLFLLKLTQYLGFYPDISKKERAVFNLLDGTFQEIQTNPYCIGSENLQLFKTLLGINFDGLTDVKLNQSRRSSFLQVLLEYYQLHLHGFSTPKSLKVFNEIYN